MRIKIDERVKVRFFLFSWCSIKFLCLILSFDGFELWFCPLSLVGSGIEILYLWEMRAFLNPALLLHDINGKLVFVRQSDYSACSDEF